MQVEARGLGKRFGSVRALSDVSFCLPPGRRVALIGPNGSGKSTLNRVLLGLLRFDGDVRLDGASPVAERIEVARHIAYVPQVAPSLSVPVRELLRALGGLRGLEPGEVEKMSARLGLDAAPLADKPFRALSGGTKQKLLIAMALTSRASLLLLDEPTASLDARTRERFFPLFDELPPETSVVLCSHRLEEIRRLVDWVLMLDEGRLVYDGPADAFLGSSTVSVLEVRAEGDEAAAWLVANGFRRAGLWWLRAVTTGEKLALLRDLTAALPGAVRDVNVRDQESLDVATGGEGR